MGGFSLLLKSLNIMIKQIVMDTCRKTCFYVLICWFFRCTDTKVSWKLCFLGHVTSLRGGAVCVWTEEETELFLNLIKKSNKTTEMEEIESYSVLFSYCGSTKCLEAPHSLRWSLAGRCDVVWPDFWIIMQNNYQRKQHVFTLCTF